MPDDDIKLAIEQFQESVEGSDFNRQAAEADTRFARLAEQWPESIRALREAEGRPCLTINRLPAFIRQVTNEARQARVGIRVAPVDNGADKDTAKVIQGIVRQIERRSHADVAYDTAVEHQVTGGFGFFRIGIDYVHDMSFEMEARIERVANPQMVYWDPNTTGVDAKDWKYAFIAEFRTPDEFKAEFKTADPVSFDGDVADHVNRSVSGGETIRLVEWWTSESDIYELVELFNPGSGTIRTMKGSEMPALARSLLGGMGQPDDIGTDDEATQAAMAMFGFEERRRRKVQGTKLVRRLCSGADVLEETPWPGRYIPICPVWGDEVVVDGRRHLRSLVRDAVGPQQMMNFWRSATTELVALAPRAPFLMSDDAMPADNDEADKWATANTRSHPYLVYSSTASAVPQRMSFASIPTGALQEAQLAQDDMKAVMGIYDTSLGARSNETSGRAILARQREANVGNFHFIDNLNRAIAYAGEVLVDIIPSVYSGREAIRILGEDGREQMVKLAMNQDDLFQESQHEDGSERIYNLNTGVYDVTVDSGPSYATQREEAREVMIELGRAVPQFWGVAADIFMRNLDFQGADELEDRLKPLVQMLIQQQMAAGQQQPQQPGAEVQQTVSATPQMGNGQAPPGMRQ